MSDRYDSFCTTFGHTSLKPLQRKVITAIMNKRDVLGVLSTGYGKSICYQLPFVANEQVQCVIVISPLIALMEDQVANLEGKCEAVALTSNLTNKQKQKEINSIRLGSNKIIYMSPEFCSGHMDFIQSLYEENRILLFAIDEAHCISSWGNEFRSSYRELSKFKENFPTIPILALTATATSKVRNDIVTNLGLVNHRELVSSFDRPNIYIECRPQTSNVCNDLKKLVTDYKNVQTIVYVRTRDNTEKICTALKTLKINAKPYHAGLPKEEKEETFNLFASGEIKWIVATVALGMGIDQTIGLIIHYGSPGDMETYYQEIGRAGRTGEESMCVLFYGRNDMRVNRILLKDISNVVHRQHREKQICYMEKYLHTNKCRREMLLEYFDEEYPWTCCEYCDNCCKEEESDQTINNVQQALQYPMFLFRMLLIKTRINAGLTKVVDILMGRGGKKTAEFKSLPFYGLGKRYQDKIWKNIFDVAILNGYISMKTIPNGFGTVIELEPKLSDWFVKNKDHIRNCKLYTYDDFMQIAYFIKETFQINEFKEIMRYHDSRTLSNIEKTLQMDEEFE